MRLFSTFLLTAFFCIQLSSAQTIEISDPAFQSFLNDSYPSCMEGSKLDTQCRVVKEVRYLDLRGLGIKSLEGIESFTSLERLWCSSNELASLVIKNMPSIKQILCANNKLAELNLENLPNLQLFSCFNNQLKQLNLKELPALRTIACDHNQLEVLDLENLPSLSQLNCKENHLSKVDLGRLHAESASGATLNFTSDKIELLGIAEKAILKADTTQGKNHHTYTRWMIQLQE